LGLSRVRGKRIPVFLTRALAIVIRAPAGLRQNGL
jgi:hypothetical protein